MDITKTETKVLKVADLRPNEGQMEAIGVHANPRQITEGEYAKLLASLREDNLTGILQEKVYNYEGEWIVLDGNMRLRALQELGVEEVQCIIVPEDTPAKVLEKIIILSNSTFGDWDMDALANWDTEALKDWGVDVPKALDESEVSEMFEDAEETGRAGDQSITILIPTSQDGNVEEIKDILREALLPYDGCRIK